MLDSGLLLSIGVVIGAMWVAARALDVPGAPSEVLDRLLLPAVAGVLIGRAAAIALDDPTSFRSLRSFLVIRGGVELWPGALGAAVTLGVSLRRSSDPIWPTLARLAPVVVVGYAAYEASCVIREGCYGPHAPIGLRPDGIGTTMVPLGILVAAALVVVALGLARRRELGPTRTIAIAVLAVAGTRALASVWLPRLGDGFTRPHRESIAATAIAAAALLVVHLRRPAEVSA